MNEPYEIVDDAASPSGKSLVVRNRNFFLGVQGSLTNEEWEAKLQAKANYFASVWME